MLCPAIYGNDCYWNGSDNAEWTNSANWDNGDKPNSGDLVYIDGSNYTPGINDPVLSSNAGKQNELKISKGGILYITTGGSLEVEPTADHVKIIDAGSLLSIDGGSLIISKGKKGLLFRNGGALVMTGGSIFVDDKRSLKFSKSSNGTFSGGTINIEKNFEIEEGSSFTMSGTTSLTVNSNSDNKGKFKVKGKNNKNGTFTMTSGTVIINAGDPRSIEFDGSNEANTAIINVSGGTLINNGFTTFKKQNSENAQFNISGGTVTLVNNVSKSDNDGYIDFNVSSTGTLVFQGDLTLRSGDSFLQSGTSFIQFKNSKTWTSASDFTSVGGTVRFDGTTTLSGTGTWQFNHVQIENGDSFSQGTVNGSNPTSISISGNWTNNNSVASTGFTHRNNTVIFNGSMAQSISEIGGEETFNNITFSNSLTNGYAIALNDDLNIISLLTMSMESDGGDVDLNGNSINLGNTGVISGESSTDCIQGTSGFISFSINMSTNNTTYSDIAGTGLSLITGAANVPGATFISRSPAEETGIGNTSILRSYNIIPSTNTLLNLTMKFVFFDSELNGQISDTDMALWRSIDGGSTWDYEQGVWTNNGDADYITLTGIDSFSKWAVSNGFSNPLPIKLLQFSASAVDEHVVIEWQTATETQNDYFTIEKSIDGISYSPIAYVTGSGTSASANNYIYYDSEPNFGISYYRLRQNDYYGNSECFSPVAISIKSPNKFDIMILPNPTCIGEAQIMITSAVNAEVLVVVYDMLGKQYYSKVLINESETVVAIDKEQNIKPGTYVIIASTNGETLQKKLVIRANCTETN